MLCLGHQLAALIPAVLIFSTLIHCVCKCLLSILIFNSELLFHVTPHSNSEIRQTLVEFLIAGYKYTVHTHHFTGGNNMPMPLTAVRIKTTMPPPPPPPPPPLPSLPPLPLPSPLQPSPHLPRGRSART